MKPGHFRFYPSPFQRRGPLRNILLPLLIVLALLGSLLVTIQMRPMLERLAIAKVSNTVTRIVSEAVYQTTARGDIQYDKLISFEKDHDGKITALYSNIPAFNRLQANILENVLTRIDQVSARELSLPIGTLTGSSLLAGRGPRISVRMESVGSSEANFHNEFIAAGINQTKHQIVLTVDVYVSILLPGVTTATKVSNSFIVAETVIVGSVPESYTYFSPAPEDYADDAKDHVLNQT